MKKWTFRALAVLAAVISLGAWALSSPIGSSPDDNFHLSSIWCAQTSQPDLCTIDKENQTAELPTQLHVDAYCFIFQPELGAECQGGEDFYQLSKAESSETSHLNISGAYPPLFYATMGFFAGTDLGISVMSMRFLNLGLFIGIVITLTSLLPTSLRKPLFGGFLATMIPLGIFIIPSTNPSSWGYIAAGSLWLAVLGFYHTKGFRKLALGILSVLLVGMGAGARSDVAAYLIVSVIIAVVFAFTAKKSFYLQSLLPLGLIVVAFLFYSMGNQSRMLLSGFDESSADGASVTLLLQILKELPALITGALGQWGLGWLDTPMPAVVWVLSFSVFVVALFVGLYTISKRKIVALCIATFVLISVPTLALFQSGATVGNLVQPRYLLPALVILVGVALWKLKLDSLTSFHRALILVFLGVANIVALWTNFRRYTTGLGRGGINLDSATWWWSVGLSPQTIFIMGAISSVFVLWAILFKMYPVVVPAISQEADKKFRGRELV